MGREIDMGALVAGFSAMRGYANESEAIKVMQAMSYLRKTCLPESYVDGLQDEILQMMGQAIPLKATTSVYLAFHGLDDRADFMKVGVARNVESRMYGLSTGNPMPRLWTFSCPYSTRIRAMKVERTLLGHMAESRVNGEWVKVAGLTWQAAEMLVASLAEVAAEAVREPANFRPEA